MFARGQRDGRERVRVVDGAYGSTGGRVRLRVPGDDGAEYACVAFLLAALWFRSAQTTPR